MSAFKERIIQEMEDGEPRLVWFFKKNLDYGQGKTYDEIYQKEYEAALTYHNRFGHDGFLSERTREEDLPEIARRNAMTKYQKNQCSLILENVAVSSKNPETDLDKTENRSDFVRWFDPQNGDYLDMQRK